MKPLICLSFQVGVEGEYIGLDKISLANSSFWKQGSTLPVNKSLIWYKASFNRMIMCQIVMAQVFGGS